MFFKQKPKPSKGEEFQDYLQSKLPEEINWRPFVIAAAVVGAAVFAQQAYRYMQPRRPKWKSQSKRPQIARWESEGGTVPQVEALRSRTEH